MVPKKARGFHKGCCGGSCGPLSLTGRLPPGPPSPGRHMRWPCVRSGASFSPLRAAPPPPKPPSGLAPACGAGPESVSHPTFGGRLSGVRCAALAASGGCGPPSAAALRRCLPAPPSGGLLGCIVCAPRPSRRHLMVPIIRPGPARCAGPGLLWFAGRRQARPSVAVCPPLHPRPPPQRKRGCVKRSPKGSQGRSLYHPASSSLPQRPGRHRGTDGSTGRFGANLGDTPSPPVRAGEKKQAPRRGEQPGSQSAYQGRTLAHPPAHIISRQASLVKVDRTGQRVNQRSGLVGVQQLTLCGLLTALCSDLLGIRLAGGVGGDSTRQPESLSGTPHILPDCLPCPVPGRVCPARENPLLTPPAPKIKPKFLGPVYAPCLARLTLPHRTAPPIKLLRPQRHHITDPQPRGQTHPHDEPITRRKRRQYAPHSGRGCRISPHGSTPPLQSAKVNRHQKGTCSSAVTSSYSTPSGP